MWREVSANDLNREILETLPESLRLKMIDLYPLAEIPEIAVPVDDARTVLSVALGLGLRVFGGELYSINPPSDPRPIGINWDVRESSPPGGTIDDLDKFVSQSWIDPSWYVAFVWNRALPGDEDEPG